MKIGVFGDIHANLSALQSVLAALHAAGCEELICTGDIVGYGPSPAECIALVRESRAKCVLGNHDEYATDILGDRLDKLEPETRASIEWTRSVIGMDALKWLAALPLRLDVHDFTVVHGCLGPHPWAYVVNKQNLTTHFAHQTTRLSFDGHTHLPLICVQREGQSPSMDFLKMTVLPPPGGTKVLVNPGSVGQPRDRDPRACCCIYDLVANEVHPIRVPYNIAETQELMRKAALPERFIQRLEIGR